MKQNNLKIHSENILPIIKKWLYSDREIFLRELVSNAADAIQKLKILRETGEADSSGDLKISISIDKKNKTLTISDTGIGMTETEVETYIAQIAFSGAEEFLSKYKESDKEAIIGHFGLGFYSSYMVSEKVEIQTLSYKPDSSPVFWSCDGASTYSIGAGSRKERGTDIILHIDAENEEFLEEPKIRELLNRYARFFQTPIDLNGASIGNGDPLWLKNPSTCTDQEYLQFYRKFFPLDPDPIFWIHLNIDYPFKLQGILYFPKIGAHFEAKENTIQLFCNRVYVSDHCREILPHYLNMLRGAIDSADLPLNVSRSSLQVDKNVKQLSAYIAKKIADRLTTLYRTEREKYLEVWPEVELILKLGILQDEKFYDKVQEILVWKKSDGQWITATELAAASSEKKIFYSTTAQQGAPIFEAYRTKGIEVLIAAQPIDIPVIQLLEEKLNVSFQRIDGALDPSLLDPSREKTTLDADGKTFTSRLADFIGSALKENQIAVEAKSLASNEIPALLILDEKQRRLRDYYQLQRLDVPDFLKKKTLVVNTNHKLIQTIERLQNKHHEVAVELSKSLYGLALIGQRELESKDLEQVIARQTGVLEKLAALIV